MFNINTLDKKLYYGTILNKLDNKEFPIFLLKINNMFIDIYGHNIYKFSSDTNTWSDNNLVLKNIEDYDFCLENENSKKRQKRI